MTATHPSDFGWGGSVDRERDSEPDPRIIAVHRVVDLEQQHQQAQQEAEQRRKQAVIIRDELRLARDELAGLLGYPSNPTDPADAKAPLHDTPTRGGSR